MSWRNVLNKTHMVNDGKEKLLAYRVEILTSIMFMYILKYKYIKAYSVFIKVVGY